MHKGNLITEIKNISEKISDAPDIVALLTHYDADGLSAGGIFTRLLLTLNKRFIARVTPDLSESVIDGFFSISARTYIILDMGSSELDDIYNRWKDTKSDELIIIDHHKILNETRKYSEITLLNPENYGLDGGAIGCTSILASLISYFMTYDPYFLEIGIVGATGDMQLPAEVKDINKYLVDLALKEGVIKIVKDFIFFANRSLPLYKAITWNYIPYIPGFSGRDDVGYQILKHAGIPIKNDRGEYIRVYDLNDSQRDRLLETILQYISSLGVKELDSRKLVSEQYVLVNENEDILKTSVDFANLLSSLGRMQMEHIGILLAAGARDDILKTALKTFNERRKKLAKYLDIADKSVKKYNDIIIVIDLRDKDFDPRFGGTISTIFSRSLMYKDKIIIVLSKEGDYVKISARASKTLVKKGLNLALILNKLANNLGGRGGGHNIAAGATVIDNSKLIPTIIELIKEYGNV